MKILEIEIFTADLKQTEKFYTKTLELRLISRAKNSITVQAGCSSIIFNSDPQSHPVYHFAFNIPNNKLNEALEWAKKKVKLIPIKDDELIADFSNWDAKAFYFYDNNGNILEFLARYELPNQSNHEFSAEGILQISEIAIVTDLVPKLRDKLLKEYEIPVFPKQPPHDNFTAMGSDEGLLILSEVNRHWFPTRDKFAQKYPLKIKILEKKQLHTLSFNHSV